VTHSPKRAGSMTAFHTSAGGAAMRIEAVTVLIQA
jgi:hypothetical protein